MQKLVHLEDVIGKRIKKRLCGTKRSRPRAERRPCNIFPCQSEWVPAAWEDCSANCGKQGKQYRWEEDCSANCGKQGKQYRWEEDCSVKYGKQGKQYRWEEDCSANCGKQGKQYRWEEDCSANCSKQGEQ
jgi:hypothetical protein